MQLLLICSSSVSVSTLSPKQFLFGLLLSKRKTHEDGERTELLALIYKGWRTSCCAFVPIIFPVYILRQNPGHSNRKQTRTKTSTSLGQAACECMVTWPSFIRYYYSRDVQIASSTPSRLSVMHGDPSHAAPNPLTCWTSSCLHRTQIYVSGPKLQSSSEIYPVKYHEKQCYSAIFVLEIFHSTRTGHV